MCDLMLSSPNDNEVICHISNVHIVHVWEIPYQNDHKDILKIPI